MAVGTQFKTSTIVLNESLMGFEDGFEFAGRVNTDYEEMVAQAEGLPTGGSISVRTHGYKEPQLGETHTVSNIEQQFETIAVDPGKMLGDTFAVKSTEFAVDRNRVTDSVHYETAMAIASKVNVNCYEELKLNTPIFVDNTATSGLSYSTIANIQSLSRELGMPSGTKTLFMNTRDYQSVSQSINTGSIYDERLTKEANQYIMGEYAGIPIVQSNTLISLKQIAGTAGGATIKFNGLVSTDSYKSAVINLNTAPTATATLKAGDRLTFQVTKRLNPTSRLLTEVPLQLIVQEDATAVGSAWTNVKVKCGLLAKATSPFFANVDVLPAVGEDIKVAPSHNLNFYVTKPGFTFATVGLENISTLEIRDWFRDGTNKPMLAPQSRNPKQPNSPINMRTSFDSELLQSKMLMRIDVQPVYKAFLRLNVALASKIV